MFKGFIDTREDKDQAIAVLQSARIKIEEQSTNFVCTAITEVSEYVTTAKAVCLQLKKAIDDLIAPCLTYSRYLRLEGRGREDQHDLNFYVKARLDWIDQMIEELKQD